jgi:hypothetical protein
LLRFEERFGIDVDCVGMNFVESRIDMAFKVWIHLDRGCCSSH